MRSLILRNFENIALRQISPKGFMSVFQKITCTPVVDTLSLSPVPMYLGSYRSDITSFLGYTSIFWLCSNRRKQPRAKSTARLIHQSHLVWGNVW